MSTLSQALRAASGEQRQMELGAQPFAYRLVRSQRRSIAIHVGAGIVETRAPLFSPLSEVEGFMRRKERWILKRLSETREAPAFQWEAGSLLPVLGREVPLMAAPDQQGIALEDGALYIGDKDHRGRTPRADWRTRVIAWLRDEALMLFATRATAMAAQLGVPAPAVHLSNAATRWGSCTRLPSGGARVRMHWKLYMLPPHLIDYVVAHELSHIRQLNHSRRFWAEVENLYPEYPSARRELNRRGRILPIL